jgi:hypothetical protein
VDRPPVIDLDLYLVSPSGDPIALRRGRGVWGGRQELAFCNSIDAQQALHYAIAEAAACTPDAVGEIFMGYGVAPDPAVLDACCALRDEQGPDFDLGEALERRCCTYLPEIGWEESVSGTWHLAVIDTLPEARGEICDTAVSFFGENPTEAAP